MKKHKCQDWFDEALGCSTCFQLLLKSNIKNVKHLKEIQDHVNSKIIGLTKEVKKLKQTKKNWSFT